MKVRCFEKHAPHLQRKAWLLFRQDCGHGGCLKQKRNVRVDSNQSELKKQAPHRTCERFFFFFSSRGHMSCVLHSGSVCELKTPTMSEGQPMSPESWVNRVWIWCLLDLCCTYNSDAQRTVITTVITDIFLWVTETHLSGKFCRITHVCYSALAL